MDGSAGFYGIGFANLLNFTKSDSYNLDRNSFYGKVGSTVDGIRFHGSLGGRDFYYGDVASRDFRKVYTVLYLKPRTRLT